MSAHSSSCSSSSSSAGPQYDTPDKVARPQSAPPPIPAPYHVPTTSPLQDPVTPPRANADANQSPDPLGNGVSNGGNSNSSESEWSLIQTPPPPGRINHLDPELMDYYDPNSVDTPLQTPEKEPPPAPQQPITWVVDVREEGDEEEASFDDDPMTSFCQLCGNPLDDLFHECVCQ